MFKRMSNLLSKPVGNTETLNIIIDNCRKENVAIVYDRSSVDSVIAATMLYKLIPNGVYTTLIVDDIFSSYYFVGTEPSKFVKKMLDKNKKQYLVINYDSEIDNTNIMDDCKSINIIDLIPKINDICQNQSSLDDDLSISEINLLTLVDVGYERLSLLHSIFISDSRVHNKAIYTETNVISFDKTLLLEQAELWKNYMLALKAIDNRTSFNPITFVYEDTNSVENVKLLKEYDAFITTVKENINRVAYLTPFVTEKGKSINVFCCNVRQDITPFVLKLAKNVYKNVLIFEYINNLFVVTLYNHDGIIKDKIKGFFSSSSVFSNEANTFNQIQIDRN